MQRRFNVFQTVGSLAVVALIMIFYGAVQESYAAPAHENGKMTDDDAVRLGEKFGIIVGPVDEEIQQELKMQRAEGVVVFEVIGGTQAELAGIKVRAVIKEIDKVEVRNLKDFGRALKLAMPTCNFTVGTYEPADPETQGVGGVMNFHFVGCRRD
ncbi:MAG: PDZ domain-containing protein [Nitrospirales bacterium]|nr:PDZ domain-containing protein [Nitrospirales bacterium]